MEGSANRESAQSDKPLHSLIGKKVNIEGKDIMCESIIIDGKIGIIRGKEIEE